MGAGYLNPAAPVERREVSVFTICEPSCGCGKIQNGMGHSCGLHCEKPTVGGNELRPVPISQCNPSCGRCGALFPLRLITQVSPAECHRYIFTPCVSLGACRASASDRLDGNGSLLLRAMRGPVCKYHDCFRGGYLTDGSMLGQPNTSLPPRYSAH